MAFPNNNYPRSNGGPRGDRPPQEPAKPVFDVSTLSQTNYVQLAESVILAHKKLAESAVLAHKNSNDRVLISTTQLRGLFALLTEVREILRVRQTDALDETLQSRVQYIKMRFVYAAGRGEKGVPEFMTQSSLIGCLDAVKDSAKQFELVCKYMEALVAYHKFYINK